MSLFLQHLFRGSVDVPAFQAELTRAWEATGATKVTRVAVVLDREGGSEEGAESGGGVHHGASLCSRGDRKPCLKIAFLEGELVEVHRAHEVAEGTARGLSDAVAGAEWRWEESERGLREQLGELTLLQTRGSKLCFAIVGPLRARNHLSEGMQITSLCHTEMAKELTVLWTMVYSAMEFTLGCSPDETFCVEVVDELVVEFQKLEEWRSRLEWPGMRICNRLLGPPSGRARRDEATR
jgi:hypothetical protein